MRVRRGLIALILIGSSAACASFGRSGAESRDDDGVIFENGAMVLTGSALRDGSGSVLGAMTGKIPNLRVRQRSGRCPEISLRSHVSYTGPVAPHIYVDGTRATDTCVLESLRTNDVERVEVYPQGYTTRPGYGRHAQGLILVFMRSA